MDRNLRDSLLLRGFRRCDICGNHLPADIWEAHHRRLRSQGGPDEAANLLSIDHQCHWRAHHWRDWARDRGYIVHAGSDFAIRPVWRHGQSWQIPTPDGWTACEPPADIDLSLTERNAA